MTSPILIKISGHELDDEAVLTQFAGVVRALLVPAVIVHGGGKEISQLQERMGIQPRYVQGIRVTDADSLQLVEMVLAGAVNKRLVRTLLNAGVRALGLSGVDAGLARARTIIVDGQDMGFTGEIESVDASILTDLLGLGVVPVVAPICGGTAHNFNVNADLVAGALAAALDADRIVFLSNVPGVLKDGALLSSLTPVQVDAMIADGTIFGGMIPKVTTALRALQDGVSQAVITNLAGLEAGTGTVFHS